MRSGIVIISIHSFLRLLGKELVSNRFLHAQDSKHEFVDTLTSNLVEHLLDSALVGPRLYRAEQDNATLGKTGVFLATHPHSRLRLPPHGRAQSSYQPQLCREIQAFMSDLSLRNQAKSVAAQMEAAMSDTKIQEQAKFASEEIKSHLSDPYLQEQFERIAKEVWEYTRETDAKIRQHTQRIAGETVANMDPYVKQQARLLAEEVVAFIRDLKVLKKAKRLAEQREATNAGFSLNGPANSMIEQMKVVMTDPHIRKKAKRVAFRVHEYMADPKVQEDAKRAVGRMDAMLSALNPGAQIKHFRKQITALTTTPGVQEKVNQFAQQIRNMTLIPNIQTHRESPAKRTPFHRPEKVNELGRHVLTAAMVAAVGFFPSAALAGDINIGAHAMDTSFHLALAEQTDALAGTFFGASLFPYLAFLYFLRQDVNGMSPIAQGGFTYLLGFVFGTIVASVIGMQSFGLSLANVDWLHADAEQLLAFTNILDVVGLKLTLDGFMTGKITQPATPDQFKNDKITEGAAVGITTAVAVLAIGFTWFAGGGDLGAHTPYLGGLGNLPEGLWPFSEPENALSVPTWVVHISSLLEWLVAQGLIWRIALVSGNPAWKGMTWAMIPSHSSGITACTYHIFYNQLPSLVLFQAFLTVVGNSALAFAAYRLAVSNGWEFSSLPSFLSGGDEEKRPEGTSVTSSSETLQSRTRRSGNNTLQSPGLEAAVPVDKEVGGLGSLATIFTWTLFASYLVKYGGAALPITAEAPEGLAYFLIAAPTAFNVYKWVERSKTGGDFAGPI